MLSAACPTSMWRPSTLASRGRFCNGPTLQRCSQEPRCRALISTQAALPSGSVVDGAAAAKAALLLEVAGTQRGIFGITAAKKAIILEACAALEAHNPNPQPVQHLPLLHGDWRLLFSTITILGTRRTKLGLREFIQLGHFIQTIDTVNATAINRVEFSVSGLGKLTGALTMRAGYEAASPQRVTITLQESSLEPKQLQQLFAKNLDLLLSIFNPAGYLDVTYVDADHRIGRDDKGNVFFLVRCLEEGDAPA